MLTDLDKLPESSPAARPARGRRGALTAGRSAGDHSGNRRTRFVGASTHVSERAARAVDLDLSLLRGIARRGLQYRLRATHPQQPTSRVSRSTLLGQSKLIARRDLGVGQRAAGQRTKRHSLGTRPAGAVVSDVASADGIRFVVPVKTIHAGPNPQHFGIGRGVTYYN
jgi:hypothetical protein